MADEFKEPMNTGAREWDAETYDAVSDPQFEWGMEVLERLELRGDEVAVDAGCGSGRVTAELAERLPDGRVIAVDGSEAMVEKAKERLGDRADYLVADLVELELPEPVDLVFSTATFHWIPDHDRLFRRLRAALKPGGRLVAQCGGQGNVAEHTAAIAAVAADPEYGQHLSGAKAIWNFASPGGDRAAPARRRLRRGPLLAAAEAGPALAPARVHLHGHPRPDPRPAAGGEAPAVRRSGPRRAGASRSSSTTCASTSRPSPPDDA